MSKNAIDRIDVPKMAAQGDVLFRRVDALPEDATESPKRASHVVAHSETGHHHVASGPKICHFTTSDPMTCYLTVEGSIAVDHMRSYDTHAPLNLLGAGGGKQTIWQVRRQREYTPEGWRMVED